MVEAITVEGEAPKDPGKVPEGAKDDGKGGITLDTSAAAAAAKAKSERPAWLPEKFASPEDMAKAYGELEKKQSAPAPKPADAPAAKGIEASGLDLTELAREVAEKGELSKESLKKATDKGVSEADITAFIDGQKAQAQAIAGEIQKLAGGPEQYTKVLDWAQANLTDTQVKAFNKAIHSGDVDMAKLAVKGLVSDYSAAMGSDGETLNASSAPASSGVKPFENWDQVRRAMGDPRYKTDESYIKEVARRLDKSSL